MTRACKPKIPILTLDPNSIIDWANSKDDDVRELMQLHEEGGGSY